MLILKPPSRRDGADQVTFYNQIQIQMPSTCSIRSPFEGTPVHFGAGSLRPASRDLSGDARSGNIHQHAVRDDRKHQNPRSLKSLEVPMVQTTNNKHALSNKLPTYLQSLVCLGSARPSTALTGLGSDVSSNLSITLNTWKLPDISSLHNVIRTGIGLYRTDANFYFSLRI